MIVSQNIANRQNFEVYTLVYNENRYNLTLKIVNTEYQLRKNYNITLLLTLETW